MVVEELLLILVLFFHIEEFNTTFTSIKGKINSKNYGIDWYRKRKVNLKIIWYYPVLTSIDRYLCWKRCGVPNLINPGMRRPVRYSSPWVQLHDYYLQLCYVKMFQKRSNG